MPKLDLDTLFEGLTEPQREAVSQVDGPLLVLAGPGSGKTTVVTRRIAHLIAQGIPPWQILALTFTNKAAGEMRERILRQLPSDLPGVRGLTVATFHSFCARLLRRYATAAGLQENYTIYDTADQRDAIKQSLKAAGLDSKNWTPASVASAISNAKNQLMDAKAYAAHAGDFYTRSVARAFEQYEKVLKANNAVDFDDLLVITAKMLREQHAVRQELQERYQYLLIDEYQDTNHAQFVIAHALASSHCNVCVVGDPDQSIYAWRGADIRNIMEFETHYPNAKTIALGQNFRSTAHIVAASDALIRNNTQRKNKRLFTELGEGEKPQLVYCRDEHHEAGLIVDAFRRHHEEGKAADGGSGGVRAWKDMAVLYRVNSLSRVLEEAFRDAQIPYVIARGTAFYERKEIKDALAYLRFIANPNDEVSLRRIINTPARGIGDTTLDKIEMFALRRQLSLFDALHRVGEVEGLSTRAVSAVKKFVSTVQTWRAFAGASVDTAIGEGDLLVARAATNGGDGTLAELVERVIRESGMEALYRNTTVEEERERLDNLEELVSAAAEFAPPILDDGREASLLTTLTAYLEGVALVSDADAIDPQNGAVTLMTLHAAKGLEFEVIAMAGLEEGLLPHSRAATSPMELEEERRLCFVGMTRAKRHLLMTSASRRTHRGIAERTVPSQFLRELPAANVIVSDQAGTDDDDDFGSRSGREAFGSNFGRKKDEFGAPVGGEYEVWTRGRSGGGASGAFPVGTLVRHPKFGVGRVEGITPRAGGTSVRVNFRTAGTKTLILEYAKLERVE